jgi:hypothetical protein
MLAILFLAVAVPGVYRFFVHGPSDSDFLASVCLRVGLTLSAIWLAFPQLDELSRRVPPWLLACVGLGLLVVVIRPRAILTIGPVLAVIFALQFVGWLFKPLPKKKPPRKPPNKVPAKNQR